MLLLVIKWIGIILLCVILFLLLLALLLLFVPFRYRADLSYKDKADFFAKVSWFLGLLKVQVSYRTGLKYCIKIFGIALISSDKKKKRKKDKKVDDIIFDEADFPLADDKHNTESYCSTPDNPANNPSDNKPDNLAYNSSDITANTLSDNTTDISSENSDEHSLSDIIDFSPDADIEERIKSIMEFIGEYHERILLILENGFEKIGVLTEKSSSGFTRIYSRCAKIFSDMEYYKGVIEDERCKKGFKTAVKKLEKTAKHAGFKKFYCYIHYGPDDNPALLGRLTMYAAMFYPLYAQRIIFEPDFENKVFEGCLKVKGRIMMIVPAFNGLTLFLNRDFRYLLKKIRRKQYGR